MMKICSRLTILTSLLFCQITASQSAVNKVIIHGSRTEKKVALTFDACSGKKANHYDQAIITVLKETQTPATLFLGGVWLKNNPQAVLDLKDQPLFELALHGHHHPHFLKLTDDSVSKELTYNRQVLDSLCGKKATLFRPPYGEYDQRISRLCAERGLILVEYDLASGDPDTSATAKKLTEYVATVARNGSIVVMHMNGRGWHTAEALPEIIRRLRKRGFQLVKVSELTSGEEKKK
jgi:peptidoglycan-N-acetylglucosamine deacetylase